MDLDSLKKSWDELGRWKSPTGLLLAATHAVGRFIRADYVWPVHVIGLVHFGRHAQEM